MPTMSARTAPTGATTCAQRRTGRAGWGARGLIIAGFVVAVTASGTPAAAAPEEGAPIAASECQPLGWGWPNGDGPAYPGQRFGVHLAPECRGPVLEGLDPELAVG